MIIAKVRFLTNNLVVELTGKADELKKNLQEIGVLTPLSMIKLDNSRTLQVHLTSTDKVGELVCNIINTKRDTLGNVQRLCRHIYCFNEQNREIFISKLQTGEINSVSKGINYAEKLREKNVESCR